jgi:hypothetical protein
MTNYLTHGHSEPPPYTNCTCDIHQAIQAIHQMNQLRSTQPTQLQNFQTGSPQLTQLQRDLLRSAQETPLQRNQPRSAQSGQIQRNQLRNTQLVRLQNQLRNNQLVPIHRPNARERRVRDQAVQVEEDPFALIMRAFEILKVRVIAWYISYTETRIRLHI